MSLQYVGNLLFLGVGNTGIAEYSAVKVVNK